MAESYIINKKSITGIVDRPPTIPVHDKYDEYEGSYTVIPYTHEQTLPTMKKSMAEDIKVEAINFIEVDNPQGGKTVTIGFE